MVVLGGERFLISEAPLYTLAMHALSAGTIRRLNRLCRWVQPTCRDDSIVGAGAR